jgi:hypothetical protein
MNYNFEIIKKNLNKKGFFIIKNFLSSSDLDKNFINYLNKKKKFVDGVIHGLNTRFYINIDKKIKKISQGLHNKDLNISSNKFCYSSIRIKKTTNPKAKLIKPFNIYKDPKVSPGGALNWHIDHFTYYFHNDHKNYLICYMPILKSNRKYSNVAIVPYDVLKKDDINTFKKIKDRGAVRFRKVEKDTKPWFDLRFNQPTKINDWYALDDYADNTQGWKMKIDLEKKKIVPKLNLNDLLIMKADVIHKTNCAKIDRIAIRCDMLPKNSFYEQSFMGFFNICLKYFLQTKKTQYNLKRYIKNFLNEKINFNLY